MIKKKASNLVEYAIIGAIIGLVGFLAMPQIMNSVNELLSNARAVKNDPNAITQQVDNLMDEFNLNYNNLVNNPNDINTRIETTGSIGQLIAGYDGSDEMQQQIANALNSLANLDGYSLSDNEIDGCIAAPSSCTPLMTVSDFHWELDPIINPDNTYCYVDGDPASGIELKDPLPVNLYYQTAYIADDGSIQYKTVEQAVDIQKEQFRGADDLGAEFQEIRDQYEDWTISQWLDDYMPTVFNEDLFTGSAHDAQDQIESYLEGTNNVLSSSKSEDLDFT